MGAADSREHGVFMLCTRTRSKDQRMTCPVILHIYDIGATGHALNKVLRSFGTGVFHCGVEAFGWEWAYSDTPDEDTGSGIFCVEPRTCAGFIYRESVSMGATYISELEFRWLIHRLEELWLASAYDALAHNCCHFSEDLCDRLGVGRIPDWVKSLSEAGASWAKKHASPWWSAGNSGGTLDMCLSPGSCALTACTDCLGSHEIMDSSIQVVDSYSAIPSPGSPKLASRDAQMPVASRRLQQHS